MTEATPNVDVTADVPADHQAGDAVTYTGSLGDKVRGVIAEVRNLFDESGTQLRAFVVRLEGVGRVLTSGDALSKAEAEQTPAEEEDIPAAEAEEEEEVDPSAEA